MSLDSLAVADFGRAVFSVPHHHETDCSQVPQKSFAQCLSPHLQFTRTSPVACVSINKRTHCIQS